MVVATTMALEYMLAFHGNFFQGFQAIAAKAWADDVYARSALRPYLGLAFVPAIRGQQHGLGYGRGLPYPA